MAHSGNDEGKRFFEIDVDDINKDERNYFEIISIDEKSRDELKDTCKFLPIGDNLQYVLVPIDLEFDPERDLAYFKKRKNVQILDKPDKYDRQVFLPGILAERVVVSPELSETILAKMNKMKCVKDNQFIHIQSYLHLMCYWSREAFLDRKQASQDAILNELRKKKAKELFTRAEIKEIQRHINSVRFDITDQAEKEMYYVLSTLERLRLYRDRAPYEFEQLDQYFNKMSFDFMWNIRICGSCFKDITINEFGGFKSLKFGAENVLTIVKKEELLQQLIYCCDMCVLTEEVFKWGFTKDDFYFKQTKDGCKAFIQSEAQAKEFRKQQQGYDGAYF